MTAFVMAIHDEQNRSEHIHQHQVNEVTNGDDNGRAKNNNCWKCGHTGHFARECLGTLQKETNLSLIHWL